ncbi:MAG TPA: FAD:protein FMN transferase [Cyclobacteriaceae bacterium]|nr:FAD:protein FMN transferase [Cyclobacteriaceae bacterium]
MRWIFILFFYLWLPLNEGFCQAGTDLRRNEYAHGQMGTVFKIICFAPESLKTDSIVHHAFSILDSLNLVLSDYLPDNELKHLCQKSSSGAYIDVSDVMYEVAKISLRWAKFSRGTFDITVGPYTQLWRRARRQERLPDENRLKNASGSVGYRFMKLNHDKKQILLKRRGMQLDFGGIGQGYAVDRIYAYLKSQGIPICLVDGGGDIYAGDPPPGEPGWKIGIESHEEKEEYHYISNMSISTSGDLYQYIEYEGTRYSHIVDPKTGLGVTTPRTATIIAPDAVTSDVLATVVCITGPTKGFRWLKKLKGIRALVTELEDENIRRFELGNFDFTK